MFRSLTEPTGRLVTVSLDGRSVELPEGDNLAVALLRAGHGPFRTTPVKAAPRMPYCMMGVCFECLAEIDGVPNRQTLDWLWPRWPIVWRVPCPAQRRFAVCLRAPSWCLVLMANRRRHRMWTRPMAVFWAPTRLLRCHAG